MLCATSGSKGGLYAWEQVQQCSEVILVEGLFDYAVLWQAGFRHLTCSLGAISTLTSFVSCAIARARSFSPSMSMPTVAANKPHSSSHSVSARKASPLAVCSCPKATIQDR